MDVWRILDHPVIWGLSRLGLDLSMGLYRERIRLMRRWGVLDGEPSVLDIGCGIGQYSQVTKGHYLGVDLNARYIRYARSKYRRPNAAFRAVDVQVQASELRRFDCVLMVDFLHHVPDDQAVQILRKAATVALRGVVSFEPIMEQTNPVGDWLVRHDRGMFVRPGRRLDALFSEAGAEIVANQLLRIGPLCTKAIFARPTRAAFATAA
jgi:2-polyprenyl-3-methyl-5-hydroxy-6-metoxy-1,4-benzoquinol methylase